MGLIKIIGIACPLFIIAGCSTSIAYNPQAVNAIATMKNNPNRVSLTAASEGILLIEDGCFVLQLSDGRSMSIVWPEGAILSKDGNSVQLGAVTYKSGRNLRLGGSSALVLPADEIEKVGHYNCDGPYFIASNVR